MADAAAFFKCMLAAKPDPEELDSIIESFLRYPLLGSPKYDGVRCTVQNGRLYSRQLKLIKNKQMQALWGRAEFNGLDAEIIVGSPTEPGCFQRTSSVSSSVDKSASEAALYVFDMLDDIEPFIIRNTNARLIMGRGAMQQALHVGQVTLKNAKQLLAYEKSETGKGHEGIMLRSEHGGYKHGRSTMNEGGLIAIKRFVDAEAIVLDTFEQEENQNEQKLNELGKMKRSSHKAGKVGKETLGGFVCLDLAVYKMQAGMWSLKTIRETAEAEETSFRIGTGVGLTDSVRKLLWATRDALPGKIIKYRYQKVGTVDKPRIPSFLGFRDKSDL
jgi:DNA ligase-1